MVAQSLEVVLPISLKYAVLDAFRYQHWFLCHASNIGAMMQLWITAASVLPDTDDVAQSMVDTLLRMAHDDELRPHIPLFAWYWLNKRPTLGPGCWRLVLGTSSSVVLTVCDLGDIGLITSYLFVVRSEWSGSRGSARGLMLDLIRQGLGGIGAVGCRADLMQRLDYVLSQLASRHEDVEVWEQQCEGFRGTLEIWDKRQYEEFRETLLEADKEAMKILTSTSCRVVALFRLLTYTCVCRMPL